MWCSLIKTSWHLTWSCRCMLDGIDCITHDISLRLHHAWLLHILAGCITFVEFIASHSSASLHPTCHATSWMLNEWHNSFAYVTWLIWMTFQVSCNLMNVEWVTWLFRMCDMTLSHVWHDSFEWHSKCHATSWMLNEWHDSFACVTWLFRMCDMTHLNDIPSVMQPHECAVLLDSITFLSGCIPRNHIMVLWPHGFAAAARMCWCSLLQGGRHA